MNYEEFITPQTEAELDVQKAVVEELAADKVVQDERIAELEKKIVTLESEKANIADELAKCKKEMMRIGDALVANNELSQSNQISLIERNLEIDDRFEGEAHDHVLEAIRNERDRAEKEGRIRCAQVLESVLLCNEPNGTLAKKRLEIQKLFNENQNVINGTVIAELSKLGISHKHGDDYLLPGEIINRTY